MINIAWAAVLLLADIVAAGPPSGSGLGSWGPAYQKAKTALAQLSLSDKVGLVTGVTWGTYSYFSCLTKLIFP